MNHKPIVAACVRARRAPLARQCGFTVIELILVVMIAAVLAVIAVPALRDTLNTTRQSSALGLLVSDLNLARGEAIKRNARVLVCVRNTAGTDCGAGTNWQAGWVVCSDALTTATGLPPNDGQCDAGTADIPNPIAVRPALDPALTLTAPGPIIQFSANSTAIAAATLNLGGTWSGAPTRNVAVANTGNISKN
jgi:type IV fimbrial biogenesis protein FimT